MLFKMLWAWAKRRHHNKGAKWVANRYWGVDQGQGWNFQAPGQAQSSLDSALRYRSSTWPGPMPAGSAHLRSGRIFSRINKFKRVAAYTMLRA